MDLFPDREEDPKRKWAAFDVFDAPLGTVVSWNSRIAQFDPDEPLMSTRQAIEGAALTIGGYATTIGLVNALSRAYIIENSELYSTYGAIVPLALIGLYLNRRTRELRADEQVAVGWARRTAELDGAVLLPDISINAMIDSEDLPETIGVGTAVVPVSMLDEISADINKPENRNQIVDWSRKVDECTRKVDECTQKINSLAAEIDDVRKERSKHRNLLLYIPGFNELVKQDEIIDALSDKLRTLLTDLERQKLKKHEAELELKEAQSKHAEYIKKRAACNILDVSPSRVFDNMMKDKSPEERDAFILVIFDALMELQVLTDELTGIENSDASVLDEQGNIDIARIHRDMAKVLLNIIAANKSLQIGTARTRLESTPGTATNFITSSVDWRDGYIALNPLAAKMIESLLSALQNLGTNVNGRQALDDGTQILAPKTVEAMITTVLSSENEFNKLIKPEKLTTIIQYLQQFVSGTNRILLENRLKESIKPGKQQEELQNIAVARMYLAFDLMDRCTELLEKYQADEQLV